MNSPMPVAWIFMLFLILAVLGALAAIIRRSWIIGSIVLLFVLLIPGMYMLRVSPVPDSAPSMVIVHETLQPPMERFEPDADMIKTADVYPSMEDAAKNLALRLCDQIQQSQPALSIKRVRILSSAKVELRPIIGAVFTDKYPDALVVDDDSHDGEVYDMTVKASLADGKRKCLALTATSQSGKNFKADTCVTPAPWVNNFDQYRSDNPKGEWIVGWSALAEPSIDAAKQQARKDAARQMLPFVTSKFPQLNPPNVDPQVLRNQLTQELLHRRFFKEEFVQKLQMPATGQSVYHAGILVDASSPQLQKLQSTIIDDLHRSNARVRRFGGGVAGMGVVICLVYLFLNWATRGYFQMNLRLGAFLVLIAGVMLMMLIG